MRLPPETTSLETFAKVLADSDLRGLLELELSDEAAERIVEDPGLIDAYYQAWRRHTPAELTAEASAPPPPAPPLDAFASAPPPLSSYAPAPPPLDAFGPPAKVALEPAVPIAGGVWSVVLAPLALWLPYPTTYLLAGISGTITNPMRWVLAALLLALVGVTVFGVVLGVRSIRRGSRASAGTPRRRAARVLGWIGVVLCSLTAVWSLLFAIAIASATFYM